jgi:pyruvate dehydrogenase kinase 2/3/4
MVRFGQNPSQGTLLKASQFLSEELPIRLSHRIAELEALPDGLNKMPSIEKVKEWYAQSFEVSPHEYTPHQRRVADRLGIDYV